MSKISHSSVTEPLFLHIMLSNNVKETAAIMIEKRILIGFSKEIRGQAFIIWNSTILSC